MIPHFAHPWLLLLLLLIPPLVWWMHWRQRPATLQYSDVRLVRGLPRSARLRLRWLPDVLRVIVLVLMVIAVARPQLSRQREVIRGRGVDIVLALDISGSMASLDFEPQNRLEASKEVIDGFIAERKYDRIGLVVFARDAFSQSPPTFDYDTLRRLLGEIELVTDLGIEDGTAIGQGTAQAAAMLQDSEAKSRVIILLTDGANNAGQIDPLTAGQAAASLGIKVYTIGMGRPGMVPFPVDSLFGTRTRMIESDLDEETLQQIADATGALYFRATDAEVLRNIYEQINQMERSDVDVQVFTRYKELTAWVLLPALILFCLEWILRRAVFRSMP